jgi:hypothetical protein
MDAFRKLVAIGDDMDKFYTLVGSRSTNDEMLAKVKSTAAALAPKGFVLRTGRALGVDLAAETGAAMVGGPAQIFLPFPRFNQQYAVANDLAAVFGQPSAYALACARNLLGERHWNAPGMTKSYAFGRKAHARNMHQVLGATLELPSKFVLICAEWIDADNKSKGVKGGTNTALLVATQSGVPVINMYDVGWQTQLEKLIEQC